MYINIEREREREKRHQNVVLHCQHGERRDKEYSGLALLEMSQNTFIHVQQLHGQQALSGRVVR